MALLGEIDLSLKPLNPELYVALPNQTVIGRLKEASGINNSVLLGKVSEVSFKIPYFVEKNHELVSNPNIAKMRERFLIKLVLGDIEEWYMINETEDEGNGTDEHKNIHCYNLGWELNDKIIQVYQETSVNATTVLNEALSTSVWNIGYIDGEFNNKYRSFDVTEVTCLEFLYQIAETFAGILEFNTKNRTISLKKEENIGINKGLKLSYGKYLKTINKTSNSDEMVTRLHLFGSEELSIQRVNPTGVTYIEDFSFFINNGYMSDGLVKAIRNYEQVIESNRGTFNTKLDELTAKQTQMTTKKSELSTLQNDEKILIDELDIAKSREQDTSQIELNLTAKRNEISSKQAEINALQSDIDTLNSQIATLRNTMSIENNFTSEQIIERNYFIIEKVWRDENIADDKDLYAEGLKQFENLKKPQTTFSIDIVNFLNIVKEQRNWKKLSIGDTVTIKYERMGIEIAAKIIEIHYDYTGNTINLTISNTFDIRSAEQKVLDKLYDSSTTSANLDMSKYKWNGATAKLTEVDHLLQQEWDATKREIVAGVNNTISISGKGLVAQTTDDPNKIVIVQGGVIALSLDGGNTWKTAIKPSGIVAETLIGRIFIGQNLIMTNASGSFTFDENGVVIDASSFVLRSSSGTNVIDDIQNDVTDLGDRVTNAELSVSPEGIIATVTSSEEFTNLEKRVNNAEQKITSDGIVTTVTSSKTYQNDLDSKADSSDLGNYATKGELSNVEGNIGAAVDGKINDLKIQETYATKLEVEERSTGITQSFHQSGGMNLLKNSLGFVEFSSSNWVTGGFTSRISRIGNQELNALGFTNGILFRPSTTATDNTYIEQTVPVISGKEYSMSWYINKTTSSASSNDNGAVKIQFYENNVLKDEVKHNSEMLTYEFKPFSKVYRTSSPFLKVRIYVHGLVNATITGLMLNLGSVALPWSLAVGEMYNTNVKFDINGIRVSQINAQGREVGYTSITPTEFAGFHDKDGDGNFDKVFYLQEDETVSKKFRAKEEFTMGSIKIISVESGANKGWGFVPIVPEV